MDRVTTRFGAFVVKVAGQLINSIKELEMWIENCAADDVPKAWHHDAGPNSMLIQIKDPCSAKYADTYGYPEPKHDFKERHFFEFLDVEDGDEGADEFGVTDEQATELVQLLTHAKENHMNVVVHCHAGICRSGAVCEVGVMMGFNETERYRQPNLRVKHKMMKVLGWTYNENEQPDQDSWRNFRNDL